MKVRINSIIPLQIHLGEIPTVEETVLSVRTAEDRRIKNG